jgi:hypothetical protein
MNEQIYAIDPGYERSALVSLRPDGSLFERFVCPNDDMRSALLDFQRGARQRGHGDVLVIEQIESYGMAVGREVFETVFWSGRFAEIWGFGPVVRLPRRDVKLTLCRSSKANDSNIRRALIDAYGPGEAKAIGRKATPGPLYGIKADLWAALAVGVTYQRLQQERQIA